MSTVEQSLHLEGSTLLYTFSRISLMMLSFLLHPANYTSTRHTVKSTKLCNAFSTGSGKCLIFYDIIKAVVDWVKRVMSLGLSLGHGSFTLLPHKKMKLGVKHSGKCSGGALLFCVGGWVNGVHYPPPLHALPPSLHRRIEHVPRVCRSHWGGLHSIIGHGPCELESLHVCQFIHYYFLFTGQHNFGHGPLLK